MFLLLMCMCAQGEPYDEATVSVDDVRALEIADEIDIERLCAAKTRLLHAAEELRLRRKRRPEPQPEASVIVAAGVTHRRRTEYDDYEQS